MMSKLKYLIKVSLNKKIKTKWFAITNVLLLVLIVGLVNADSIVKFFGGDFEEETDILVIDNTNSSYANLEASYLEYQKYVEDMKVTNIKNYTGSIDEALAEVENKDSILIEINSDENNFISAKVTSKDGVDAIVMQLLNSSLNGVKTNLALNYYNISNEMLSLINSPVEVETVKLDDSKNTDEMMELLMGVIFPIVILPFFMLTIFLVQMIGAEINEEKTTRGMEIIISNVPAKIHLASKIIASNVFVILQGLILIVDAIIALFIRVFTSNSSINKMIEQVRVSDVFSGLKESGVIDSLAYVIPIMLILMLLTFIAYSLLSGVLASMTTNLEDFQQLQTPIVIISLVGYYLAMMAAMFDGSIFIKVASYIPFISALLTPALLLLGQIGIIDVIISLVLLILAIFLLYKYGLKIYKVGILNYSSTGLWKKMFKAMKS